MAAATVDVWGAISQLVDDPALLSVEQLAVLSQVLTYVPPTIGGDQSGLTALLLGTMDGKEGGRDVEAEYVAMKVMDELEHRVDEVHAGPGRGYSLWPRAPDRVFTPVDRVGQYRVHPDRFRKKFSLYPNEFDLVYGRVHAALAALPHRKLDLPNRLAQALRYCRTGMDQETLSTWFGCGHSCANDDIDEVVAVLFNDPALAAEISWPTQAEGDAIVTQVAAWRSNLSGCLVAGDAKKRATNVRGRTFGDVSSRSGEPDAPADAVDPALRPAAAAVPPDVAA